MHSSPLSPLTVSYFFAIVLFPEDLTYAVSVALGNNPTHARLGSFSSIVVTGRAAVLSLCWDSFASREGGSL